MNEVKQLSLFSPDVCIVIPTMYNGFLFIEKPTIVNGMYLNISFDGFGQDFLSYDL